MSISLVEGWTEPIGYQLSSINVSGTTTPQNLVGLTVSLVAYGSSGVLLPLSGTVAVTTPETGMVTFSPAPGDLLNVNSPMAVRWRVADGAGKVAYFPSGAPERWIIQKP